MQHQRPISTDPTRSILTAILLATGIISFSAHAAPSVGISPAITNSANATNETRQLGFRMTHRAVLSINDHDVALTGALTRSPDNDISLALLVGFGTVLAEVRMPSGGAPRVVRHTPPFRARWARQFALRDALRLFAYDPLLKRSESLDKHGRRIVEGFMQDGTRMRLTFPPNGQTPERIEAQTRTGGQWVADCEAPKYFEALGQTLPTRYRLNAGVYSLDLTLLTAESIPAHP